MSLSAVASGILAVEERAVSSDVIAGTTFPASTATIPIAASMIPRSEIAIAIAIHTCKPRLIWNSIISITSNGSKSFPHLEIRNHDVH